MKFKLIRKLRKRAMQEDKQELDTARHPRILTIDLSKVEHRLPLELYNLPCRDHLPIIIDNATTPPWTNRIPVSEYSPKNQTRMKLTQA
jgi:hypothetical protein